MSLLPTVLNSRQELMSCCVCRKRPPLPKLTRPPHPRSLTTSEAATCSRRCPSQSDGSRRPPYPKRGNTKCSGSLGETVTQMPTDLGDQKTVLNMNICANKVIINHRTGNYSAVPAKKYQCFFPADIIKADVEMCKM